jgi:hypothetical protein
MSEVLPADRINSEADYVVFSDGRGIISEHPTATDAIKNFAAYAANERESDAVIYKRENSGEWRLF